MSGLALLALVPAPAGAASGSGSLTLLVVYVALAIGVSFLCSVMEAVLLSVTPAYVGALEDTKPDAAARLKALKADVDQPLAAILTLNTIAHTIGAAGAGAEAAGYFGAASVGIFSAVLTLGILVLSEIIPKTIGATYWRGLAPLVARMLVVIVTVLRWTGLIWLSQAITKLIARGKKESAVSREELAALAQIGTEEGVFDETESRILRSLFRFNTLNVRDVMTPRTVVVAFPETAPLAEVAASDTRFSRLPVYGRDRDHITGLVLRDDVLAAVAQGRGDQPASSIAREILTVPDSLPLPELFDRLLDRREHMALVVGEYGGTAGVATVEDVIETLLDLEIQDETDEAHDMQTAARQRWSERAVRLGIVSDDAEAQGAIEQASRDRQASVKYGITGGKPLA